MCLKTDNYWARLVSIDDAKVHSVGVSSLFCVDSKSGVFVLDCNGLHDSASPVCYWFMRWISGFWINGCADYGARFVKVHAYVPLCLESSVSSRYKKVQKDCISLWLGPLQIPLLEHTEFLHLLSCFSSVLFIEKIMIINLLLLLLYFCAFLCKIKPLRLL